MAHYYPDTPVSIVAGTAPHICEVRTCAQYRLLHVTEWVRAQRPQFRIWHYADDVL